MIGTPANPERWTVKDTSVNIASAFHRAAGNAVPAYDTSASSSSAQNTFNTSASLMNPNDSWAAGVQPRTTVPRSTSVEYEKETQSIITRRLNAPPSRGLPRPRPLARTDSVHKIPDSGGGSSQDSLSNGRPKTFGEQVMDATRRLAPATFFMRRQSEEPEPRPGNNTSKDKSSSYEYDAEEHEFQDTSQQDSNAGARRNVAAHRRNRMSADNKAYRPTMSDLDESESDYESDEGKRTKTRRGKKAGGTGGPLRTLPVAGYDKRKKKRRYGAKGEEEEDSGEEEPSQEYSTGQVSLPCSVLYQSPHQCW